MNIVSSLVTSSLLVVGVGIVIHITVVFVTPASGGGVIAGSSVRQSLFEENPKCQRELINQMHRTENFGCD
ncbi:Hypothetical predicted protein [Octopus vulgaris]|uniref:Uncharacterized protein n=1 Tax=Octopus vulgaris TaxID=6645 RepID=A0AA36AY42_OCTVU|nr:Hypothetical predicted protein [Octopus vulgaris]